MPSRRASTGAGATSLPTGPAIYPGNGGAIEHVTLSAPAKIYTPWGVITDEYGTGATVPPQYPRERRELLVLGWRRRVPHMHDIRSGGDGGLGLDAVARRLLG